MLDIARRPTSPDIVSAIAILHHHREARSIRRLGTPPNVRAIGKDPEKTTTATDVPAFDVTVMVRDRNSVDLLALAGGEKEWAAAKCPSLGTDDPISLLGGPLIKNGLGAGEMRERHRDRRDDEQGNEEYHSVHSCEDSTFPSDIAF
jgi:hypothetical protein